MDKQGQEGARAFYLQTYDGNQGYTFDRIGRGEAHIPRVCLAMLGQYSARPCPGIRKKCGVGRQC